MNHFIKKPSPGKPKGAVFLILMTSLSLLAYNTLMIKVNRYASKEEAAAAGGEALNQLLLDYKKSPVLLLLSGGSALELLNYISPSSLGENLTVATLDERFSEDPAVNNFLQMQKLDFYVDAQNAECSFFGTLPRPGETKEALAQRLENNLKQWLKDNPQGKIFATLGMGADGHTAGVFPLAEDPKKFARLFGGQNLIAVYDAAGKSRFPLRITAGLTFLKQIDAGVGLVCGMEKQRALEAVLKKQGNIEALPALSWHQIKKMEIFTDIQTA